MNKKEIMMEKVQSELQDVCEAIDRYAKANNNEVAFIGSFVAFDEGKMEREEEDITKDGADRIIAYGSREVILIQLEELKEMLLKEEDDFVNW